MTIQAMSSESEALEVVRSRQSLPDEKTLAAEFLHQHANEDGRHEQLLFEVLDPLLEAEHRFNQGRPVFLKAVRLVAELASRRQRWKAANNALVLLGADKEGLPAWARSYRAKTYFKLQPRAAVARPDLLVELLGPIDELTVQGKAVLEEYVFVARQVFTLDGDPDGSKAREFEERLRELTGAFPLEASPHPLENDTVDDEDDEFETGVDTDAEDARRSTPALTSEELSGVASSALTRIDPEPATTSPQESGEREQELEEQLRQALARISELEAKQEPGQDPSLETLGQEIASIDRIIGRRHILVLGAIQAKPEHLVGKAKNHGLSKSHLRFESDYEKLTQYDLSLLQYSNDCAGILIGALPHMIKGLGGATSALQLFETEEGYPPAVGMRTKSGELKGTKGSFDAALGELLTTLTANTAAA